MSHGGKRPNAGRKPGSASTKTREVANKAAEAGITPLEVMLQAMMSHYKNGNLDEAALKAKDAAPYVHAKLASIEQKHSGSIEATTKEQRDAAVQAALRADT